MREAAGETYSALRAFSDMSRNLRRSSGLCEMTIPPGAPRRAWDYTAAQDIIGQ